MNDDINKKINRLHRMIAYLTFGLLLSTYVCLKLISNYSSLCIDSIIYLGNMNTIQEKYLMKKSIIGEEKEASEAKEGHNAAVQMAQQVAEAVKGLQGSMDAQSADRQKALEALSKPKKVIRGEDGRVEGVE